MAFRFLFLQFLFIYLTCMICCCVAVWPVHEAVPLAEQAAAPPGQPPGRARPEEVQVLPLRQGLQVQAPPQGARENSHRGEALRVQALWQAVFTFWLLLLAHHQQEMSHWYVSQQKKKNYFLT